MAWSKRLNKCVLTLSDLELPGMTYVAPITAISRLPEYRLYHAHARNRPVDSWEDDL